MNKNDIIGFIGNTYVWKQQSLSDQAAVDIMYYASFDPAVKQQAFYYGLTVAKPKTQKVLNRLVGLAMEGYGVGRIAWGIQDQRDEFLDLLKPYLSSDDTIESQQAQNIARVIEGKKYWVYIYDTGKGETTPEMIEKAQNGFADRLDQIKQNLLTGTSSERLLLLEQIFSENIYLLLDDSFIPAVRACAEDKDSKVRIQTAELAGCYWLWGNTMKNPEITQLLIQLSTDNVKEVCFAAIEKGLFNIPGKDENVIKRIIDITLSDKKNIPEKLHGRIGKVLRYCNKTAKIILERYLEEQKYSRRIIADFYRDYLRSELPDR